MTYLNGYEIHMKKSPCVTFGRAWALALRRERDSDTDMYYNIQRPSDKHEAWGNVQYVVCEKQRQ
jgi:hypothetical protein